MGRRAKALLLLLMGLFTAPAFATPLGIQPSAPDLSVSFASVSYDATSHVLSISGFPATYKDASDVSHPVDGGATFSLTALIDNSGVLTPSGSSLTISGTIAALGYNSGTLLAADLTQFGFATVGDTLEFYASSTGGDLSTSYGAQVGIIVNSSGYPGSWVSSFSNAFGATVDVTTPAPAPATLPLLVLGIAVVGVAGWRRGRGQRQIA